ncbi:hypothetical protein JHK87_047890 [Glycine soja]|uniref:Uncharacterized protein n=1 Tax=Glycine max TaxID=3847 RepID=A0A0R0FQW2_SOYBN|nr:hypothetical protein JHK87_047890 [Glycine soja]
MADFLSKFASNVQATPDWWSLYVDGASNTKEAALLRYYLVVKTLIDDFNCFEMHHIPREENTRANLLSKLASTKQTRHLKTIIQETFQTSQVLDGHRRLFHQMD